MVQTVTDVSPGYKAEAAEPPRKVSALRRLHHHAFPVADQEVTRQFMEDLLGVPLMAMWSEENEVGGDDDPEQAAMPEEWGITKPGTHFCHTFYELADGGAIAFFQFDGENKNLIGQTNIYSHIALETDQAGQDAIHQRLLDAGVAHIVIHHGYVTSLYVTSPDGLLFEVCVDPEYVDDIRRVRSAAAHSDLQRWLSGDHTTNNQWREMSAPPVVYPGRYLYERAAR